MAPQRKKGENTKGKVRDELSLGDLVLAKVRDYHPSLLRDVQKVSPQNTIWYLLFRGSLNFLVFRLSKADDCICPEVEKLVASFSNGGVLLLENVRFYKEEEKNGSEFAKKLASLADLFVNDTFGTAHRAHASTEGVTKFLKPSDAGYLMQKAFDRVLCIICLVCLKGLICTKCQQTF